VTAVDTIRRHKAETAKLAAQVEGVHAATAQQRVLAKAREQDVSADTSAALAVPRGPVC